MKRLVSLILIALLVLSLMCTAMAGTALTPSVENREKEIKEEDVTATTGGSKEIKVVTKDREDDEINWDEEIVITPVSILKEDVPIDHIGGNLKTGDGGLSESSKKRVLTILETAYEVMTSENKSLYTITKDTRFNRDDLTVCNLFEVTYANKLSTEKEFGKTNSIYSNITLTFTGIEEDIVAVLHGNDAGTVWNPLQFKQEGQTVKVYGFSNFSPVAFVTAKATSVTPIPDIQPDNGGGTGGGGQTTTGTVPTSPQTGTVSAAWVSGVTAMAFVGVCGALRRRKAAKA